MLETLSIENLALVDSAELEFGPGLNVLTGETGAGKSIILGALSLLAGGRASADTLRAGTTSGAVEAVFAVPRRSDLYAALEQLGLIDAERVGVEGDASEVELVVHRSLSSTGRGRVRVGGQLVPVSTLSELFDERLEISSQHSSQALRRVEAHGQMLDAAGALLGLRAIVAKSFARVRAIDDELARLRAEAEERARRLDFLSFQRDEIDAFGLDAEQVETLERDHARLAHAERLGYEVGAALGSIAGTDGDGADEVAAITAVVQARRALEPAARIDPSLASLVERLEGAEAELRDVGADLERYASNLEVDPAALAHLDEQLGALEKLRRKYGATIEDIQAHRAAIEAELDGLRGADDREGALAKERKHAIATLEEAGGRLSEGRKKAARKLARSVADGLRELSMPNGVFEVALDPIDPSDLPESVTTGPTGREQVAFLFSANPGEKPRPLQKTASGGELSRVFLALKNALRGGGEGMVLVFDEVDAGIGGGVAERVGRVLAELATAHQVLCITHLPQIAAFADEHFLVEKVVEGLAEKRQAPAGSRQPRGKKATAGGRTVTRVRRLTPDERVDEIARMAGGEAVTEATRSHARDLLRVKNLDPN